MKFLCIECDQQMAFAERQLPGDGTLAATFKCPKCGRVVAMLTNPMETQLVSSLGVEIGGWSGLVEWRAGTPVPRAQFCAWNGEEDLRGLRQGARHYRNHTGRHGHRAR